MDKVNIDNLLAEVLKTAGSDVQTDEHVKNVLAMKPLLARIFKETVEEVADYSLDEIERMIEGVPQIGVVPVEAGLSNNPKITGLNTEDTVQYEGSRTFDVLTYLMVPGVSGAIKIITNLEGQKDTNPGYDVVIRGVYYAARKISSQYGTEFTHSKFNNIKKVYSIWICFDSREDEHGTITEYCITKNNVKGVMPDRERYDLISVVLIRLGGDIRDYENYSLEKLLMTVFSEKITFDEKRRSLEEEFGLAMTEAEFAEVRDMCNYSLGVAERNIKKGYDMKGYEMVDILCEKYGESEAEACRSAGVMPDAYREYKKQKADR